MTRPPMDRTRLAAFADGELSPEAAAEVVMHLADHPEDQAWVDELMAANAALARAFAAPMQEDVPEAIHRAIFPDAEESGTERPVAPNVLLFRTRLARAIPAVTGAVLAVAATLAAVAFFLEPREEMRLAAGPVTSGSALHRALEGQPSGSPVAMGKGELMVLASLPAGESFCREVEYHGGGMLQIALACREGLGWTVDVALSEPIAQEAQGQSFTPASGEEVAVLDRWLTQRRAGVALTPEEERDAMRRNWAR